MAFLVASFSPLSSEESLSPLSLLSLESSDSAFFALASATLDTSAESDSSLESEGSAVFTIVPLTRFEAGASDSLESSEDSSDEEAFLTALGFETETVCAASSESESEDSDDSEGAAFFVGDTGLFFEGAAVAAGFFDFEGPSAGFFRADFFWTTLEDFGGVDTSSDESESSSDSPLGIASVGAAEGGFAEDLTVFGAGLSSSLESDGGVEFRRTFTSLALELSSSDELSLLSSDDGSLGVLDCKKLIGNRTKMYLMVSHTFPFATGFLFAAAFACGLATGLAF